MRKLLVFLSLVLLAACQTTNPSDTMSKPPATTTPTITPVASAKLAVVPDIAARVAQMPRTVIDYDRSLLNENERQVVAKLIEASKFIDEIFWRQASQSNPELRTHLQAQGGAGYDYFLINRGRWDRLKENEPFIEPFAAAGARPPGAGFYPPDMTKEEFERYVAAHPDQKAALEALFTVVRRNGANLAAVPYSQAYRDLLEPAAQRLREASALTAHPQLKTYLAKVADAFGKDDYRDSDMAWMDLAGPIEVVIGPYEVYEDELFNYKAAFESFVTVVDAPESAKLAAYAAALPDMERNLPEPEQYRNPNRGSESPIRVVQEIYTAGDARQSVQTAAFNLPNDEFVREKKGSKKVLLKNVINAKFVQSGKPIALRVLDESQLPLLNFDAFFNQILFHELSHGLGPGYVTQKDGTRVEARIPLKNLYSTIEETKADVLGLWNIVYARNHNLLSSFDEKQLYATYAGLMFRSMRFGIGEAHGRGTAVQWNWLREAGGVVPSANGRFRVDFAKFADGVKSLSTELLTIEATGDFDRAQRLLNRYGVVNDEINATNAKLTDIPVDITPVFPAAGER
jgi:peptidase M49-like protein